MSTVERDHRCRPSRHGFTLIEMLVVIAIIGILASLLLPALLKVKERGKMVFCQNNLKNLGLAIRKYCIFNGGYFPLQWGTGKYPVETMCETMGLANHNFAYGDEAPKVILCPSCEVTAALHEDHFCRHYALSAHVCGNYIPPGSDYETRVTRNAFPEGFQWPWPSSEMPDPRYGTFHARRMDYIQSQGNVVTFMDSNDTLLGGAGTWWDLYDWYFCSQMSPSMYPTRHLNGGNMVFVDGHVEWKPRQFFENGRNRWKWLADPAVSNPSCWWPTVFVD
ncbi:MAG TPA: prepilin-type N-terminal cleavage/methylation domain-containing protein [Planctomycetota bacterium]|nr:prepilin-type N-terminal cleavage/methylation domain-containing protein [Planctomycetota bacterium]